jgi:hypothetical protein
MNRNVQNHSFTHDTSNIKNYLLLFLLWPFLAFIHALANYTQKEARKVVYFFLIYYGLCFFIDFSLYYDAVGNALRLKNNSALPFSDFFKIVGGLYSSETSVDILEPLISFIVSRFTSDYRVLFAVFAALFGFFYLRSFDLLYDRYVNKPNWNAVIHLIYFILIIPITSISGFRYYTAAWIFFYGAYHVILYRDPRYIILSLSSSFVHFSFLTANAILIIYFISGNRNLIYIPLVIISFVMPHLMGPFFKTLSLRLGGSLQSRYEGYSNEGYISGISESYDNASWFLTLSTDLVFYYLLLAIVIIQLKTRKDNKSQEERNLFSFLLIFLSFVNFGKVIPSLGGRFQTVFLLFTTFYIFLFYVKRVSNKINLITLAGIFPMFLNAAVTFRVGSESINAWIFTPGFGLPLLVPGISIAEFLFK